MVKLTGARGVISQDFDTLWKKARRVDNLSSMEGYVCFGLV